MAPLTRQWLVEYVLLKHRIWDVLEQLKRYVPEPGQFPADLDLSGAMAFLHTGLGDVFLAMSALEKTVADRVILRDLRAYVAGLSTEPTEPADDEPEKRA